MRGNQSGAGFGEILFTNEFLCVLRVSAVNTAFMEGHQV
jgi:hypothetical protein